MSGGSTPRGAWSEQELTEKHLSEIIKELPKPRRLGRPPWSKDQLHAALKEITTEVPAFERRTTRGRPEDLYLEWLIYKLALLYGNIVGAPPGITTRPDRAGDEQYSGSFIGFLKAVLRWLGWSTRPVGSRAKRALRQARRCRVLSARRRYKRPSVNWAAELLERERERLSALAEMREKRQRERAAEAPRTLLFGRWGYAAWPPASEGDG